MYILESDLPVWALSIDPNVGHRGAWRLHAERAVVNVYVNAEWRINCEPQLIMQQRSDELEVNIPKFVPSAPA